MDPGEFRKSQFPPGRSVQRRRTCRQAPVTSVKHQGVFPADLNSRGTTLSRLSRSMKEASQSTHKHNLQRTLGGRRRRRRKVKTGRTSHRRRPQLDRQSPPPPTAIQPHTQQHHGERLNQQHKTHHRPNKASPTTGAASNHQNFQGCLAAQPRFSSTGRQLQCPGCSPTVTW